MHENWHHEIDFEIHDHWSCVNLFFPARIGGTCIFLFD